MRILCSNGGCGLMLFWGSLFMTLSVSQSAYSSSLEDVEDEREWQERTSESSPVEDFFYILTNSINNRWGKLWRQNSRSALSHPPDRPPHSEATDTGGRNSDEVVDVLEEVTPVHHHLFDIKRKKRKLPQKKSGHTPKNQNSQQKNKTRRKKQHREKLLRTILRKRTDRPSPDNSPDDSGRMNIILIVADDLGFNDVPWHNPDVKAPNLLKLAREGVILENHYVLPLCTPSRAALLTGDYPFRYGKQGGAVSPLSPTGLNASVTLLPQRLKNLGYSTHLIGKWHLGYCSWDYTPTRRGFDSFYGFYLGSQTYYTQFKKLPPKKGAPSWWDKNEVSFDHDYQGLLQSTRESLKKDQLEQLELYRRSKRTESSHGKLHTVKRSGGRDFRFNEEPLSNISGVYSNELYASRAEEVIRAHGAAEGDNKAPLFLMLSMQTVHGPVQVPLEYRRKHTTTRNMARRTFLGMVNALDEVVGRVVAQLKASGLYNNSLIVFTTDNGGNVQAGGNNFPLRGNKGGLFEGGTRGVAFIHSPLLPKTGYKYTGMMHIVDMHETLLHAAENGVPISREPGWQKAFLNSSEVVSDGSLPLASNELGRRRDGISMWPAIVTDTESPRCIFVYNVRKKPLRGAIRRKHWKLIVGSGGRYDGWVPPSDVSAGSRSGSDKKCCSSWHSRIVPRHVTLYNLKEDPLETTDVSHLNPRVTATLTSHLRRFAALSRQPQRPKDNFLGHPNLHRGFFSPGWCQAIV